VEELMPELAPLMPMTTSYAQQVPMQMSYVQAAPAFGPPVSYVV
jgi:hypothetical protein